MRGGYERRMNERRMNERRMNERRMNERMIIERGERRGVLQNQHRVCCE